MQIFQSCSVLSLFNKIIKDYFGNIDFPLMGILVFRRCWKFRPAYIRVFATAVCLPLYLFWILPVLVSWHRDEALSLSFSSRPAQISQYYPNTLDLTWIRKKFSISQKESELQNCFAIPTLNVLVYIQFFLNVEEHKFFLCGHRYPCFRLLVMSALGFKVNIDRSLACFVACMQRILLIHLWCNTCWPLGGHYRSGVFLIHVLADHVSTSIGGGFEPTTFRVCLGTALLTIQPLRLGYFQLINHFLLPINTQFPATFILSEFESESKNKFFDCCRHLQRCWFRLLRTNPLLYSPHFTSTARLPVYTMGVNCKITSPVCTKVPSYCSEGQFLSIRSFAYSWNP